MPHPSPLLRALYPCALLLLASVAHAHEGAPAKDMVVAAKSWLGSLDAHQKELAAFPFHSEERENWHYIPKDRNGLTLRDMSPSQREGAKALVASALSQRGQLQVEAVIALEEVLFAIEHAPHRNPTLYYFSVFGTPDEMGDWGWRLEGHHISLNFTLDDGLLVSATPFFLGSNPGEVRIEHPQKGKRVLGEEENKGFALLQSFTPEQRARVVLSATSPEEIITGHDRTISLEKPAGLSHADMTPAQREELKDLVALYAKRLRAPYADAELARIANKGWDNVFFAWNGADHAGEGHYYRIQGPGFIIEFDNTQNHANHIHTVWRDTTGDFGRDTLREHYERDHAHEGLRAVLPLPSRVYPWTAAPRDKDEDHFAQLLLRGKSRDLAYFEINGVSLAPGQTLAASTSDQERLLLVKEGTLTITLGGASHTLTAMDVVLVLPGETLSVQAGGSAASYHELHYISKAPVNQARAVSATGPRVLHWGDLKELTTEVGLRRNVFERPTAMLTSSEMHVTTLRAGLKSHPPHTHRAAEIIVMASGETEMVIGGVTHKGHPGDVFYVDSEVPHGIQNVGAADATYFAFQWQ